jgi:hypothetical protein
LRKGTCWDCSHRIQENTAADQLELSAEQIERLNNLTPAAGERHE